MFRKSAFLPHTTTCGGAQASPSRPFSWVTMQLPHACITPLVGDLGHGRICNGTRSANVEGLEMRIHIGSCRKQKPRAS
jgi:hypothetical protein